jgi:hypothetical protein
MKTGPCHTVMIAALALAAAFPSVTPAAAADHRKLDPNETVCERETIVGSRLATRRTCMTRAQWAEQNRLERQAVEQSQTRLCVAKNGSCMSQD